MTTKAAKDKNLFDVFAQSAAERSEEQKQIEDVAMHRLPARQSMAGQNQRVKQLISISKRHQDALKAYADRYGRTISRVVEDMIEEHCKDFFEW